MLNILGNVIRGAVGIANAIIDLFNPRITESGDTRVSEDGDRRILESDE